MTARGSLQLRGLTPETVGPLNAAVAGLHIVAREGLTLDLSPLCGVDPAEIADARPLAAALRAQVAGLAGRLGPKVSVVLDGGGAIGLDALSADIRLRAVPDAAGPAWELALAGDAAHARVMGQFGADAAVETAVAWLTRLVALGPRARMGDVLMGTSGAAGPDAMPPGMMPTRPTGGRTTATSPCGTDTLGLGPSSPLGSGPPSPAAPPAEEGHAMPAPHPALVPQPAAAARPGPPIGRVLLRDGRFAQGVALPFGQMEAEALAALATAAQDAGARDLRPAPGRVLLACGLTADAAARFAEAARALGFLTTADDPRARLAACPGAPACRSAHRPARAVADAVAEALAPLLDGSMTVHLSACAKGCAHPAPAPLTLVGMDEGVGLVREGTAGAAPERVLAPERLLAALAALAQEVESCRRPGEDARTALARIPLPPAAGGTGPRQETMLESQSR